MEQRPIRERESSHDTAKLDVELERPICSWSVCTEYHDGWQAAESSRIVVKSASCRRRHIYVSEAPICGTLVFNARCLDCVFSASKRRPYIKICLQVFLQDTSAQAIHSSHSLGKLSENKLSHTQPGSKDENVRCQVMQYNRHLLTPPSASSKLSANQTSTSTAMQFAAMYDWDGCMISTELQGSGIWRRNLSDSDLQLHP